MSNIVSLFKGQVGLGETAMSGIQQVIVEATSASAAVIRDELRPMRELLSMVSVQYQEMAAQFGAVIAQMEMVKSEGQSWQAPAQPIAKGVTGLDPQKKGNEILAMLFDKMPTPHPSRLRPFYTDLEAESSTAITATHTQRISGILRGEEGKYPYRKIDTALTLLDPDFVFGFAKSYKFSLK